MNKDLPTSINRRILWQYVNKKINRLIHHYHVLSVIEILFDEIMKDLKQGKSVKVFNFGTLSLKKTKPRKYYNVVHKQVMESKGYKILKFILAPKFRKKLCQHLDIDKTLKVVK